ncbi:hypothetical protein MA16_Dca017960 [Dendrobium catenatum]|uniref:Uncharacterized protein n=1 Tax=Dendrobium catenatum TaxID=906689 RepID=A0A2I0X9I6_9ASPA|nr:hypothetical protein MA16_Dca017960 [Dendrobium catenatum]
MCYVRGKWVRFDCVTINHNYKLRDFKFDEYTHFSRAYDLDEILRVLCGPHGGVIWKERERERKIINFLVSYLTQLLKSWQYLPLLLKKIIIEETRDRDVLYYVIYVGYTY